MKYIKIKTDSFCPHCNETTVLVSPFEVDDLEDFPSFYVCFKCGYVGQVGVGEVMKVPDVSDRLGFAGLPVP